MKKRKTAEQTAELNLVPVKLSDDKRAQLEHARHTKLLALRAEERSASSDSSRHGGEIKRLKGEINDITDQLEQDTELRNQKDLFVSPDAARKGLAAVATAAGERHAFVEPKPEDVPAGEAPKCAREGCGKFVDEAVHVVAAHPYPETGPCPCGEAPDSPCHQVAPESAAAAPASRDDGPDIFARDEPLEGGAAGA